jgi:pimeloyl-ACP methyl ester carboxylesterase
MPGTESEENGLFLRIYGPPKPRGTLLVLHGLGDWGGSYEGLVTAPPLSGLRVLVPDLPGYGRSPRPAIPRTLAGLADDLALWLGKRGERAVPLLGHSMGGVIAQLIAERHPESTTALVNVEGNISKEDCSVSGRAASQSARTFIREGFKSMLEALDASGKEDPGAAAYARSARMSDPAVFHLHSCELVALSEAEDLAQRMAKLAMPAHYVAGSPGGAGPRSIALLARAAVPVSVIRPAGHCPFLDQPAAFLKALAKMMS